MIVGKCLPSIRLFFFGRTKTRKNRNHNNRLYLHPNSKNPARKLNYLLNGKSFIPSSGRSPAVNVQLIHILDFFRGKNKKNTLDGIYSYEAFRGILKKIRARSERTGETFSLVVFGCNNGNGTDVATLTRLGKDITRRTRKSDEVGWYDGNQIGAILAASSAEEAWEFVEVVKERFGVAAPGLICTVYSYPARRTDSDVQGETTEGPQTFSEQPPLLNLQAKSSGG